MACLRFLLFDNPIVEREELFLRGVGEDSDIVTKVLFSYVNYCRKCIHLMINLEGSCVFDLNLHPVFFVLF